MRFLQFAIPWYALGWVGCIAMTILEARHRGYMTIKNVIQNFFCSILLAVVGPLTFVMILVDEYGDGCVWKRKEQAKIMSATRKPAPSEVGADEEQQLREAVERP